MQAETKRADGLQHKQTNQPHETPLPAIASTSETHTDTVIPEGLEKLYAAIHGDLGERGMTWMK